MHAKSFCLFFGALLLPTLASCGSDAGPSAAPPKVKPVGDPPSEPGEASTASDEFRPRNPAVAPQESLASEGEATVAGRSTPSSTFAFDGLYEAWIAEVAKDFETAKKNYAGKRIRLRGRLRDFGHASRDGKAVCELNLEADLESRTPEAVAARNYAPVGTICTMEEPPWTRQTLASDVTVVGVPFFHGSGSSTFAFLEAAMLEGEGTVVEYPRVSAVEIAEAVLRERDAAAERYESELFIVTGEVVANDRWTLTLRGAESYTVQNNYGGAAGPAFDDLKPGDRVELLGKIDIFDEYAAIDGEVNYGYRP